jgi:hypothetical protein
MAGGSLGGSIRGRASICPKRFDGRRINGPAAHDNRAAELGFVPAGLDPGPELGFVPATIHPGIEYWVRSVRRAIPGSELGSFRRGSIPGPKNGSVRVMIGIRIGIGFVPAWLDPELGIGFVPARLDPEPGIGFVPSADRPGIRIGFVPMLECVPRESNRVRERPGIRGMADSQGEIKEAAGLSFASRYIPVDSRASNLVSPVVRGFLAACKHALGRLRETSTTILLDPPTTLFPASSSARMSRPGAS